MSTSSCSRCGSRPLSQQSFDRVTTAVMIVNKAIDFTTMFLFSVAIFRIEPTSRTAPICTYIPSKDIGDRMEFT